jgi:hypothetical protein
MPGYLRFVPPGQGQFPWVGAYGQLPDRHRRDRNGIGDLLGRS